MKFLTSILAVIAALVAVAIAPSRSAAQALKPGSKAPDLKGARWLKGKPVRSLADGKTIRVVVFWATWCPTCRDLIPYLTELAHQFQGKVAFTAVSVWEREPNYVARVERFVKGMGDRMDYGVCVDDRPSEKGTLSVNWLKAADQGALPTAFAISREGDILWIGSPMGLEPILGRVVAGTFDLQAQLRLQERERAAVQAAQRAVEAAKKLVREGKEAEGIAALDRVLDENPDLVLNRSLFYNLALFKYSLLLEIDEKKAMAWAAKLADGVARDRPELLNALAWFMVEEDSQVKEPDLELAYRMARRAVELTRESSAYILDTLALIAYKKGDTKAALAWQEKAVARLGEVVGGDETTNRQILERLALYKKRLREE